MNEADAVIKMQSKIDALTAELEGCTIQRDSFERMADGAAGCIEELQAEKEALQAELKALRWIPVEERLPENQERVDVYYFNELGKIRVTVAEYVPAETMLAEDYLSDDCPEEFYSKDYDKENDCYWTPEGWYESTYHGEINWYLSEKIIGWKSIILPTPTLPKQEADNG